MKSSPITLIAAALLVLVSIFDTRPAHACGNAVLSDVDSVKALKEAEAALDEGDVDLARELASGVRRRITDDDRFVYDRALRVEALSWIRDPRAGDAQIVEAMDLLGRRVREMTMDPAPPLAADYGEALERAHHDEAALLRLTPLAERDLIGSAYAYAALSRAAGRKGDIALSTSALTHCRAIAANPRMCTGEYPSPPLLHGRPLGYVTPGALFLLAALLRLRPWRRRVPGAAAKLDLALAYQPFFFTGLVGVAGIFAFGLANARSSWSAAIVAIIAVVLLPLWQRRAFLVAAMKDRIPGLHARALEPAVDGAAPLLRIFFGPPEPITLERTIDPSYRESARAPIARVGRRSVKPLWIALALIVGVCFAGCGSLVLLTARSTKSEVLRDQIFSPEE